MEAIVAEGVEGAELFLTACSITDELLLAIESIRKQNPGFYCITLHLPFPKMDTVAGHIQVMEENFKRLAELNPLFINSHS